MLKTSITLYVRGCVSKRDVRITERSFILICSSHLCGRFAPSLIVRKIPLVDRNFFLFFFIIYSRVSHLRGFILHFITVYIDFRIVSSGKNLHSLICFFALNDMF